jgi:hypothetical protein
MNFTSLVNQYIFDKLNVCIKFKKGWVMKYHWGTLKMKKRPSEFLRERWLTTYTEIIFKTSRGNLQYLWIYYRKFNY